MEPVTVMSVVIPLLAYSTIGFFSALLWTRAVEHNVEREEWMTCMFIWPLFLIILACSKLHTWITKEKNPQ